MLAFLGLPLAEELVEMLRSPLEGLDEFFVEALEAFVLLRRVSKNPVGVPAPAIRTPCKISSTMEASALAANRSSLCKCGLYEGGRTAATVGSGSSDLQLGCWAASRLPRFTQCWTLSPWTRASCRTRGREPGCARSTRRWMVVVWAGLPMVPFLLVCRSPRPPGGTPKG